MKALLLSLLFLSAAALDPCFALQHDPYLDTCSAVISKPGSATFNYTRDCSPKPCRCREPVKVETVSCFRFQRGERG